MSKLSRAQSKTGKTGKGENDTVKEQSVSVIGRSDIVKEGRDKAKGKHTVTKRRKGPDGDSGK